MLKLDALLVVSSKLEILGFQEIIAYYFYQKNCALVLSFFWRPI